MATLKVRQFVPDPWEYRCGRFITFETVPSPVIQTTQKLEIVINGVLFAMFPSPLPLVYDIPGPTGGKWYQKNVAPRDSYTITVMTRDGLLTAQAALGLYPVMLAFAPVPQGPATVSINDQVFELQQTEHTVDMVQEVVKWST